MKVTNYTIRDWYFWYSRKRIIQETGGVGGESTSRDYSNDSIIQNSQNTEKSPGGLRRLALTQTLVKD